MPTLRIRVLDWEAEAKKRGITPLEVYRQELRRALAEQADEWNAAADEYIREVTEEFGEPTPEDWAYADDLIDRLYGDRSRQAG